MKTKFMGASALVLTSLLASQAFAQAAAPAPAGEEADVEAVVVTGTRTSGLRAVDSAAPVQVVGNDMLTRSSTPNLVQELSLAIPSIQAQFAGGDQEQYSHEFRLDGLSPNDTLLLVNGERRHGSASVAVGGGPFGGGAAPDVSFIPNAAIDHIEVLQDGAAAQYGTDAIAGVVNMILKKADHGGELTAQAGQYIDGGGLNTDISGDIGFAPVPNSFINISFESKFQGNSFRGDIDPRVVNLATYNVPGFGIVTSSSNASTALLTTKGGIYSQAAQFENYPYSNRIAGDAQEQQQNVFFNSGYDITPDVHLYAFGSVGYHDGRGYENYRLPNVLVNAAGTPLDPGGFNPMENNRDTDYALSVGVKGSKTDGLGDLTYNVASNYGRDYERIYVLGSGNAAYYLAYTTNPASVSYGPPQTNFHDGDFTNTQWANNVDLSHTFNVGLADPITLAAGAEYRIDSYQIKAGDPQSYYGSGAQSFEGYAPDNAGYHQRESYAGYFDANVKPIKQLTLDGAVRYEHYSDFGGATVEKLTARYDFNDAIALRGTASTGFRAPTLAEEYYSGINVGPTSISGIFAPNSAGAALLGLSGLKPETSTNYSVGVVTHFLPRLTMTLDAYSINVENRIVQSGSFYGYNGNTSVIQSPSVLSALTASGIVIPSAVTTLSNGQPNPSGTVAIQSFVNGASTITRGLDYVATYPVDYGALGHVDYSFSANYNVTTVTSVAKPPKNVNQGVVLLDPTAISTLVDASPKYRATLNAYWTLGNFSANVRESYYGSSYELAVDPVKSVTLFGYDRIDINNAYITDLELGYKLPKGIKVFVGANNLLNVYPTQEPTGLRLGQLQTNASGFASSKYPSGFSPFGYNGGFYYGRVTFSF
jgi:iron complex outermembrane receptor protein